MFWHQTRGTAQERRETLWVTITFLIATIGPVVFTRYEGGVACLWLATAVLGSYLASRPPRRWAAVLLIAATLNTIVTATIGLGPAAAVPLGILSVGEAVLLAMCLRRWHDKGVGTLASPAQVGVLLLASLGVSVLAAFPGAAVAAWASDTPYGRNFVNWVAGHTLGTVTLAPIMLLLLRGDATAWLRETDRAERIEAAFLGILVCSIAILAFSQHAVPLLFLPILPVMMATFRIGRIGATVSIGMVVLVGTAFTVSGEGPIAMLDLAPAVRIQFLPFYLAAVVLTVLPAAADLRRRKEILDRLAISEARYRLVSENATDVVLSIDSQGMIRYISPSVAAFGGGYTDESLIGTEAVALILPEHQPRVRAAYRAALEQPGVTQMIEYRGLLAASPRGQWLEARFRNVNTLQGGETVCAIRDISARKATEAALMLAASTDPLTGLNNRRVFNDAIDAILASARDDISRQGCLAVFDIDHFKAINDGFGHDAGDRVLQQFAQIARSVTRAQDLVARLGGEEFGVLLPGATLVQAQMVCDRLRLEFERSAVEDDAGTAIRATVSAGVARIAPEGDRDAAMRAADNALYEAKRTGRNRLVMAA